MIDLNQCSLGIELGSTRIKAVFVGDTCKPVAQGDFTWENRLENGIWTYPLEEVWQGVQAAYAALAADVLAKCGQPLTTVGCIGVSAMMHGYLAFDAAGKLLVPFRTWRNTMTGAAAEELTSAFGFNIPQRWSAAHLYQAMLNREPHLQQLDFFTTLAGYVHWQLTGRKVLGKAMPAACSRLTAPPAGMMPQCSQNLTHWQTSKAAPWILSNCCLPFCPQARTPVC